VSSDLADFLLARIAEDEAASLAAATVRVGLPSIPSAPLAREWTAEGVRALLPHAVAGHVARWDPARVLAECQAKRRIVDTCVPRVEITDMGSADRQFIPGPPDMALLRLLALPYADHPDYRSEWRS
jgi:hypothetical protein